MDPPKSLLKVVLVAELMTGSQDLTAYLALQRLKSSLAVALYLLVLDSVLKIFAKHLACLIILLEFLP